MSTGAELAALPSQDYKKKIKLWPEIVFALIPMKNGPTNKKILVGGDLHYRVGGLKVHLPSRAFKITLRCFLLLTPPWFQL